MKKIIRLTATHASGNEFQAELNRDGKYSLNKKTKDKDGKNITNKAICKVQVDTLDKAYELLKTNDYLINLVGLNAKGNKVRGLRELAAVTAHFH
ncbi:hypothetical protein C0W59_03070 [Photobacterium kishitanii]|uniref:hypothetical protein n=1 Tax=Photobacterium kishitanii TaxID=318456 RepID=UPI000D16376A|nr:hypothetical protein [Photobacterium kishitanii]PSV18231.1 hypothetical protein C0W59_03070 [Photobacterium kishitanii]